MSEWDELLTVALLGTARRPLRAPGPGEPSTAAAEVRVLAAAAAHQAAVRVGRAPLALAPPETGPGAVAPEAPPAAGRLLDALLERPDPALINHWLRACARHGCAPAPRHWPGLASRAAHSNAYDRSTLATVLGPRGRWFCRQNPDWKRLAAIPPAPAEPAEPPLSLPPERLAAEPELIFAQPDPWPDALVGAAWAQLAGGRLGTRARAYATGLGARLTAHQYRQLGAAADHYLLAPDATPAQRRAIRGWFVEMERAAYARIEIDQAFGGADLSVARVRIASV